MPQPNSAAANPNSAGGSLPRSTREPLHNGVGRRQWLTVLTALCGAAVSACSDPSQAGSAVSLEFARAEFESGRALLIDIREPDEHATGVAHGARLLPMKQLAQRLAEIPKNPAQPVLLICRTQNRSSATLRALAEQGYRNVRYVEGGMSEWARRGWPMVKPPARPGP